MSLSSINEPIGENSVKDFVFYVEENGIQALREGCQRRTQAFITYYASKTSEFVKYFLITSVIAFALIAIFQLFVMLRMFSVNRTNIKVVSLFGYIPPIEIKLLIDKCLHYLEQYQSEIMATEKNDSYSESKP